MVSALTFVGCSVAVLVLLTVVYAIEDSKGTRVFLTRAREALDALCFKLIKLLSAVTRFFTHGLLRMLLHYGVHNVLKRVQKGLQGAEKKVEDLVRKNRKVAKHIRAEKTRTHLDAIAEHKEEVALSETQKDKMRLH